MTSTPPPAPYPGGLALHLGTLAQVARTLVRRGEAVTSRLAPVEPDTGSTTARTGAALLLLTTSGAEIGDDLTQLGHRVAEFARDAVDTDHRVGARLDLLRQVGLR